MAKNRLSGSAGHFLGAPSDSLESEPWERDWGWSSSNMPGPHPTSNRHQYHQRTGALDKCVQRWVPSGSGGGA